MRFRSLLASMVMLLSAPQLFAQEYEVRFDSTSKELYVRACFEPGPSLSLRAASSNADRYLVFARRGDNSGLRVSRNRMYLPASDQRRCVRYGVDFEHAGAEPSLNTVYPLTDAWLSWTGIWLWRPTRSIKGASIRFRHPPGNSVSAPWPLHARAAELTEYRFDGTPGEWTDLVAFGRFETRSLAVPGGEFRLAVLPGSPPADERHMRRWIGAIGEAIASVYGSVPLPSAQVLVVPISRGNGPVPWGHVRRGGGAAVHLFVNQNLEFDEFIEDWTASHEFSHLFHPYMGSDGRWLAEGIASYYQNISRARVGQLSENDAWRKLNAGFERGRKQSGDQTLRRVNRNLRNNGQYMRVYWSGAALAFLADLELRLNSHGRQSLDTVLAEFGACYLPAERMWSAAEFMAALDQIAGSTVFMNLYQESIDSPRFPDLEEAYRSLGLSTTRHGQLRFDSAIQNQRLRDGFTSPEATRSLLASCPGTRGSVG